MKLTKVHRILKFKQSDWLKKYIDFNREKMLSIALKKIFLKLINNSVYGKTIKNFRKIVKFRLVNMLRTIKDT